MWWYVYVLFPHLVYHSIYHSTDIMKQWIPYSWFVVGSIGYRITTIPVSIIYVYPYFKTWNLIQWISPIPIASLGFLIGLLGIYLNSIVYRKIGVLGVYYNCEWNGSCKYIEEFPYDVLKHPMYFACWLCILGSGLMFGFEPNYMPRWELWMCHLYLLGCYGFSMYSESLPRKNKSIML